MSVDVEGDIRPAATPSLTVFKISSWSRSSGDDTAGRFSQRCRHRARDSDATLLEGGLDPVVLWLSVEHEPDAVDVDLKNKAPIGRRWLARPRRSTKQEIYESKLYRLGSVIPGHDPPGLAALAEVCHSRVIVR